MDREFYIKPFGKQQMFSFLIVCLFLFNAEGKAQEMAKADQPTFNSPEAWNEFIPENVTIPEKRLSSLVIYRPSALKGRAINVYIDGEYQASLLPGAYTQAMVCPGNHHAVTAYTNPATRYQEKKKQGKSIGLKASVVSFYQVTNHPVHGLTLLPLSKEEASSLFEENPPKKSHTISRLDRKACLQPDLTAKHDKGIVDLKKKQLTKKQKVDDPGQRYPKLGTHQIEVK